MDWLDKLDEHGHNVLVDELILLLKKRKRAVNVVKRAKNSLVGFEFHFENEVPHFISVVPDKLDKHWEEAKVITSDFKQLRRLKYTDCHKALKLAPKGVFKKSP